MSNPRGSTDEETAPLLDNERQHDSFFSALTHPSRKLTNLEKLLAGLAVILLVLASTFIGLFAGAQHSLNKEKHNGGWHTVTDVITATHSSSHSHTASRTSTPAPGPTSSPHQDVCLTEECILLSAQILQSLNTSVDPCEDFYQYANGGWEASHSIPADRGIFGSFYEVADNNKKIIVKILDAIPDKSTGSGADAANLHKAKAFYESCKDIDELNRVGLKPLLPHVETLIELFGEFDLIPSPDADDLMESVDWVGTYTDSYEVSSELNGEAIQYAALKNAKKAGGGVQWDTTVTKVYMGDEEVKHKPDLLRKEKLTKTLAWLNSRGVDALVNFVIEGDAGGADSQVQSLWLYQASGGLPAKEYYEEKPILDLYTSVVAGVLTDIASHTRSKGDEKRDMISGLVQLAEGKVQGWPWPWPGDDDKGGHEDKPHPPPTRDEPVEKRMERLAAKVVHFERDLIRAGADPEYLFNPHYAYNPYSTQKVGKNLPFLDIPAYLSAFAIRAFPQNITVTHPPYLHAVTKLVDSTPDYVLSGYFTTRLAMSYATALGPKTGVRAEVRRLEEVLKGIKKGTEENRQDVCLNWVDNVLGFIVGKEFVREAFSPAAKKDGEDIINEWAHSPAIVKAFHDKLPHISWMDSESAKAAQKKAEAIIPKVGYPLTPNTTDSESLARWYARVQVEQDDFFGNILRSTQDQEIRSWSTLGRQRDRQTWEMYPQTVNAYYSPPDGEIVFPAGILQPPFYSHAWPAHLKYGAFGAVAAHELTHAFDNSGSQYDEEGRLRDWWTNSTVKAFQERAQCVAKQYSKYYVLDEQGKKVYVNGNLTNGEDIADSGLAQAYIAWKDTVKLEKNLRLPGLNYTDEQLFFIAFARIWVALVRPATAVSRVRTDPHSPGYWRATGTLMNLPAFHDAFQCKEGSRMNPPKKEQCALW